MENIYYDSEFTGLHNGTTPISIGLTTKDNHFFYAEFTDCDVSQFDKFILDEVIANTIFLSQPEKDREDILNNLQDGLDDDSVMMYGTVAEVTIVLNEWLANFKDDIQFISDVDQYDMVVIIDILTNYGSSLDLPKFICADCININTFIAMNNKSSIKEAFDVCREDLVDIDKVKGALGVDEPMKHNSLWDAVVIKDICENYKDIPGGYLLW
jgi:hypothetical protein